MVTTVAIIATKYLPVVILLMAEDEQVEKNLELTGGFFMNRVGKFCKVVTQRLEKYF